MISGFSKQNKSEKTELLKKLVPLGENQVELLKEFHLTNKSIQKILDELSENAISNYALPFSIAPNFLINNKLYFVPMVTEESSVVAAAAHAAKFWADKCGFKTRVLGIKKTGQIYFTWNGNTQRLQKDMPKLENRLLAVTKSMWENMRKRGGGITGISLDDDRHAKSNYLILNVDFETADSMGANLINSCLETMAPELILFIKDHYGNSGGEPEIIMAILSNYTPDCLVECEIECEISQLSQISGNLSAQQFAGKFETAVKIAQENISRAVTHNKGIFNGIDAVLLATGNDFRAVEACGHAYAAMDGNYKALSHFETRDNQFRYMLRIPLSVGTVGGATSIHPLAGLALQILQNPTATELMQIVAAVGLASNFAAVRSLITEGIQKGHMKLHLNNILHQFNANDFEKSRVKEYFKDKPVSFNAVSGFLDNLRAGVENNK